MGKGGMVRLVFFQTLLLTAAHAHCLRIALGAKFWFLSSLKISPPKFLAWLMNVWGHWVSWVAFQCFSISRIR